MPPRSAGEFAGHRGHARGDPGARPRGPAAGLRRDRAAAQLGGVRDPGGAGGAGRGLAGGAGRPVAGAGRLRGRRPALGLALPSPGRGRGYPVQGPAARPVLHLGRHVDRPLRAGGALGRDRQPGGGADPAQGLRDLRPVPPVRADQRRGLADIAPAHPGRRVRLRPVRRRRRHGRDGHAAADHRTPGDLAVDGGDALPGPARRPAGGRSRRRGGGARRVRPRRGSGAT